MFNDWVIQFVLFFVPSKKIRYFVPLIAYTDGRKQTTPCKSFASSLQDSYTPRQGTQRERTEPSSRAPPTLRISRNRGVPSGRSLVLSVKTVSVHPKYTRESAHTPSTNEPSAPILSNPPLVHCTQDKAIQETELRLPWMLRLIVAGDSHLPWHLWLLHRSLFLPNKVFLVPSSWIE